MSEPVPRVIVRPSAFPLELEGVWLKVARAQEHLEAYEDAVKAFIAERPFDFSPECDLTTREKVWRIRGNPLPPPIRISGIVGDVIQNLRSAFDHLAWQMVLKANGTPSNRTSFPLELTSEAFKNRANTKLRGMTPQMKDAVRDLQPCFETHPYRRKMLAWLEELNNLDKHRHLHLAVASTEGGMWSYGLPMDSANETFIYRGPIEEDTVIARVHEKHMNVDFGFFGELAFQSGHMAWGEGVFSTLIGFRELTRRVVEEFTGKFFADMREANLLRQ